MFKIFDIICFGSFMFLFGEILYFFCKDAFIVCNKSIKENNLKCDRKDVYNEYQKLRKII